MALKVSGSTPVAKKVGVDYELGSHLSQPVTGMKTVEHLVKGKPLPEGIQESETIHPGVFTDGTSISVEASRTLNLGNYESARIGITLTVPCDKSTIEETYEWASDWASKKMEQEVKSAKG